jgi:hypothetical protein
MVRRLLGFALLLGLVVPACTDDGDDPRAAMPAVRFPAGEHPAPRQVTTRDKQAASGRWVLGADSVHVREAGGEVGVTAPVYRLWRPGWEAARAIEPPLADDEFSPLGLAGDEDGFVAWGNRCTEPPPGEFKPCSPSTPLSYRFDPGTRRWSELDVPDDVAALREIGAVDVASSGGGTLAHIQTRGRLLLLRGDTWFDLGSASGDPASVCVTGDDVFTFEQFGASVPSPDLATVIRRRALDRNMPVELPLPSDATEDGALLRIACDRDTVYLASTSVLGRLQVRRWAGSRWESLAMTVDVAGLEATGEPVSTQQGIAFLWNEPCRPDVERRSTVVVVAGTQLRTVTLGFVADRVLPIGGTTQFLAVAPRTVEAVDAFG